MIFIFIIAIILLSLILAFIPVGIICNHRLVTTKAEIISDKIPVNYDGFKVLQISDLHNCAYSKNNKKLINAVRKSAPDIIAITGDMIDSRKTRPEVSLNLAKELTKIAPCYYVTGNHEARLKEKAEDFIEKLTKTGVTYLDNKTETLTKEGEKIILLGVKDPYHYWTKEYFNRQEIMRENLQKITHAEEKDFRILLSHRPETFDVYTEFGIDVCLTGHAHGGQIRLPLIGGLFAPCQGFSPEYTSGVHTKNSTNLLVSRGLGNSSFPLRIFNPPELVLLKLTSKTK